MKLFFTSILLAAFCLAASAQTMTIRTNLPAVVLTADGNFQLAANGYNFEPAGAGYFVWTNLGVGSPVFMSDTNNVFYGTFINANGTTNTGGRGGSNTVSVLVTNTITGAAGSSASVTNLGTSVAVLLRFTIPAGADGTNGLNGTNIPLESTNIFYGTNWWAGPTNGLVLNNNYYYWPATGNGAVTQFWGAQSATAQWGTLIVSNMSGGAITLTVSGAKPASSASTNLISIPAGAVRVLSALSFGNLMTNFVNTP